MKKHLEWLLPWRAKRVIAELKARIVRNNEDWARNTAVLVDQLESVGKAAQKRIDAAHADNAKRDAIMKQLAGFLMVSHRVPMPSPPGSIRAKLQSR